MVKNNILTLLTVIAISAPAFADMNSYLEITPVENCRTFVAYENVCKTQDSYSVQTFSESMTGPEVVRLSNHGLYRLYNFGSAPGCNAADGNKITIRLNGGEAVEVKIPMNHPSNELFLSIGVDMQDSYEIKSF